MADCLGTDESAHPPDKDTQSGPDNAAQSIPRSQDELADGTGGLPPPDLDDVSAPPGLYQEPAPSNDKLIDKRSQMKQVQLRVDTVKRLGALYYNGWNVHGCFHVFMQLCQALQADEATPAPVLRLLDETVPHLSGCLNTEADVWLLHEAFEKVLKMDEHGDCRGRKAKDLAKRPVLEQAFDRLGTRNIQERLLKGDKAVEAALFNELPGHGVEVMKAIEAHRVAEVICEHLPSKRLVDLLLKEMEGHEIELAMDKFACRVLCRMVRFCGEFELRERVVEALLQHIPRMYSDTMGSPVLEAILEYGTDTWRHRIFVEMKGKMRHLAAQKCGSYVLERALRYCGSDQPDIIDELLVDTSWANTPSGRFVAKALHQVKPECPNLASRNLKPRRQRSEQADAEADGVAWKDAAGVGDGIGPEA
jgi:hypothetical protein